MLVAELCTRWTDGRDASHAQRSVIAHNGPSNPSQRVNDKLLIHLAACATVGSPAPLWNAFARHNAI
jgi:hypothetical protein